MATITVTLPEGVTLSQGKQISFAAPCDSTGVTGIIINNVTYALLKANGNSLETGAFISGALISVLIDLTNHKAYIQNDVDVDFNVTNFVTNGSTERTFPVGTSGPTTIQTYSTPLPIGKYYLAYTITQTGTTNIRNTPQIINSDGTFIHQFPGSNYNTTTGRKTWTFDAGKTISDLAWWGHTLDIETKIKDLVFINLTAAFGAGNEPTAAEMGAILAFYPNSWLDGTVNLASSPKMLPYLLNTLRSKVDTSAIVNDLTTGGTTNALSAEQGKALSASISDLKAQELQNTCIVHPRLPNGVINTFENGSFVKRVNKYALQASDFTSLLNYTNLDGVLIGAATADVALKPATHLTFGLSQIAGYTQVANSIPIVNALPSGYYFAQSESFTNRWVIIFPKGKYANLAAAQAALAGTVIYYQLETYNTIALPTTKTPNTQEIVRLSEKDAYLNERLSYGVYSGLGVTQQTVADMTVNVATGTIYMANGTRFTPTANNALAITAADATNPRIDIVYVNSSGVIAYLAGTASASPTAPSVPSGGQKLAEISVAANATTIVAANIADMRKTLSKEAWVYPTLLNGWTAYGGGNTLKYYKNQEGVVRIRGAAESGISGSDVFLLPTGYRPASAIYCTGYNGVMWFVTNGGDIQHASGPTNLLDVDISFLAEQ